MIKRNPPVVHDLVQIGAPSRLLHNIKQVSFFFGAIVDAMCGNEASPKITEIFSSFDDLCMFLQKNSLCPFWSEGELTSFQKEIESLKGWVRMFLVSTRHQIWVRGSGIFSIIYRVQLNRTEDSGSFTKGCLRPYTNDSSGYMEKSQGDVGQSWMRRLSVIMKNC